MGQYIFHGDLDLCLHAVSLHGYLCSRESACEVRTAYSSVQPFLKVSVSPVHRLTDHAALSLAIGCIYAVYAMRPNNKQFSLTRGNIVMIVCIGN